MSMTNIADLVTIRPVRLEDAREILDIYAPYITDSLVTFETEVPTLEEFTNRISEISSFFPYLVAEYEGKVVGYAYAHSFRERAAYDWSVETSIYVLPEYHRFSIGRHLYEKLEALLVKQGITCAIACITYPNPDSITFHEKVGYTMCGKILKCAFKLGQWCGIVFMEKILADDIDSPKEPVSIHSV